MFNPNQVFPFVSAISAPMPSLVPEQQQALNAGAYAMQTSYAQMVDPNQQPYYSNAAVAAYAPHQQQQQSYERTDRDDLEKSERDWSEYDRRERERAQLELLDRERERSNTSRSDRDRDYDRSDVRLSSDTSSKDPELLKARLFIGNLNTAKCTRLELIEMCKPYGKLKALSMLKNYAFVQYETEQEAQMAIKILNGYLFYGQKLDVRTASIGKGSIPTSAGGGPIRRPRFDFLFGGQKIRAETANERNRLFSKEIFGALKDIDFYDHGREDTIICGSCRTTFPHIKKYITHRRQRKCNFFEREVAPSCVSCFTCKEEFNEPWLFIQHLIHKHSINLYRGQPESDPVAYMERFKKKNDDNKGEKKDNEAQQGTTNMSAQEKKPATPVESNGVKKETQNGAETPSKTVDGDAQAKNEAPAEKASTAAESSNADAPTKEDLAKTDTDNREHTPAHDEQQTTEKPANAETTREHAAAEKAGDEKSESGGSNKHAGGESWRATDTSSNTKTNESWRALAESVSRNSAKERQEASAQPTNRTQSSSSQDDIPSYSSAISIGVTPRAPPLASNVMPPPLGSRMFMQNVPPMNPSFHSQMYRQPGAPFSAAPFNAPPPPLASSTAGFANFGVPNAPSSIYSVPPSSLRNQQQPSRPQVSLQQFVAQSAPANQGGLSEEDQMKLLQEFDMDKN